MQIISIAGRVGKDAASKAAGGSTVTEWTVAINNGRDKDATWYKCSLWGTRGEKVAGFIRKGESVAVSGKLTAGVYDGRPDLKIEVAEVTLLGGGQRDDNAAPQRDNGGSPRRAPLDDLDDGSEVPF